MEMNSEGILGWTASLSIRLFKATGEVIDYGVVSTKCVTTAFANLLVDKLQGLAGDLDTFKYHDFGTGTASESEGNTTLQTPTGEAREVGSQVEGATANIYKSIATHTFLGTFTITEHGLFNAATDGVLMDRSKLASAIPVNASDTIEATYQLTFTAGS
jgi:hypothetical protein